MGELAFFEQLDFIVLNKWKLLGTKKQPRNEPKIE